MYYICFSSRVNISRRKESAAKNDQLLHFACKEWVSFDGLGSIISLRKYSVIFAVKLNKKIEQNRQFIIKLHIYFVIIISKKLKQEARAFKYRYLC